MVLLAQLPLVDCSEKIEVVSLSYARRITAARSSSNYTPRSIVEQYRWRNVSLRHLSLHGFFHATKNKGKSSEDASFVVPHYVGIDSQPTYPVTEAYAKAIVTLYKPWFGDELIEKADWIPEFNQFINMKHICPLGVTISYQRMVERYIKKTGFCEPLAADVDHASNELDGETKDFLDMANLGGDVALDAEDDAFSMADKGLDYAWSLRICTVSYRTSSLLSAGPYR